MMFTSHSSSCSLIKCSINVVLLCSEAGIGRRRPVAVEHVVLVTEDVVVHVVLLGRLRRQHERLHERTHHAVVVRQLADHLQRKVCRRSIYDSIYVRRSLNNHTTDPIRSQCHVRLLTLVICRCSLWSRVSTYFQNFVAVPLSWYPVHERFPLCTSISFAFNHPSQCNGFQLILSHNITHVYNASTHAAKKSSKLLLVCVSICIYRMLSFLLSSFYIHKCW